MGGDTLVREEPPMDARRHWEQVYQTKAPESVSWYSPHLQKSLGLVRSATHDPAAAIIDVGGGEATLVDDLLALGYRDLTVLDISQRAIEVAQKRLGPAADSVTWLLDDITTVSLEADRYEVWHDRAVFHFLTEPEQRQAYVGQVMRSVKAGGHVIVATFGPEGPEKCSGLETVRYDAKGLHGQFGGRFELVASDTESHQTPMGTVQQFLYCFCRVVR